MKLQKNKIQLFILNENFHIGIRSILVNKSRTLLSMLGIIIGIAAVIIVTSIGLSATYDIKQNLESVGTSNIIIFSRGRSYNASTYVQKYFTSDLPQDLKDSIYGINYAMANVSTSVTAIYGSDSEDYTLKATTPQWTKINSYNPLSGRFITDDDINKLNIVVGQSVVEDLFGNADPVGEKLLLSINDKNYTCTIIGVMESKTRSFLGDFDNEIYIHQDTYKNRISNSKNVSQIILVAKDAQTASQIVDQIEFYLNRIAGLDANSDSPYYRVMSMGDMLEMYDSVTGSLTLLLAGVAAISLIVGGIGIMNIMLVSVTERTREIGIRKALGAKRNYILSQFLMESSLITFIGGMAGVLFGLVLDFIVAKLFSWHFLINVPALVLSVVFSILIGVFFGYYPALKASKLNPVEALLYE